MSSKATCRCCLIWSADKDMKVRNNWLGETEVYVDMLKECFEIHINVGDTAAERGICFSCILRLRDAFNFKKQVLKCQREFEKHLQKRTSAKDETQPKVKQEIIDVNELADDLLQQSEDENFFDFNEDHSNQDDGEDEQALALLAIKQLTKRQALRKATTDGNIQKVLHRTLDLQKDQNDEDDGDDEHTLALLAIEQLMKRQALRKGITDKNNIPKVLPKNVPRVLPRKDDHKARIVMKKPEKRVLIRKPSNKHRFAKHQHNVSNIIKYSNVTPFFTKTYNGFECAYCRKPHKDMQSLKLHTSTHDEKKQKMLAFDIHLARLLIKLDITDLKCNICSQSFDVISNLKQHLTKEHKVKFYSDIKDCILEFKLFDDDKFDCALCNSPYETFKMLQQHMNRHYKNFMCNDCGSGFVNQNKLSAHIRTQHMTGEFKCSQCDKVFTSNIYRNYHEKHKHNTKNRHIKKCLNCNKRFPSYYQRNRHMLNEHKTAPAIYKCKVCDKSFLMKFCLTSHIKKDHLLEKKHSCSECEKQFYSRHDLNLHMVKHTGEKQHKCAVCCKAYARKNTLREHMRIHLNDRKFKCGICGLAFVQKCSLKSHMLSKHNLTLSEYESTAQTDQDSEIPESKIS